LPFEDEFDSSAILVMKSHHALCQNDLPNRAISFATYLESVAEQPAKPDEKRNTHQLLQLRLKRKKSDKPASRAS
jgi:hypothetical protein